MRGRRGLCGEAAYPSGPAVRAQTEARIWTVVRRAAWFQRRLQLQELHAAVVAAPAAERCTGRTEPPQVQQHMIRVRRLSALSRLWGLDTGRESHAGSLACIRTGCGAAAAQLARRRRRLAYSYNIPPVPAFHAVGMALLPCTSTRQRAPASTQRRRDQRREQERAQHACATSAQQRTC